MAKTVLIVEDNELNMKLFRDLLEAHGYQTSGTSNGFEALDLVRKLRPDLKVLFTSGYTENAIVHHGRLDSGVLLLAKPYRKSELARMIRKALEG